MNAYQVKTHDLSQIVIAESFGEAERIIQANKNMDRFKIKSISLVEDHVLLPEPAASIPPSLERP